MQKGLIKRSWRPWLMALFGMLWVCQAQAGSTLPPKVIVKLIVTNAQGTVVATMTRQGKVTYTAAYRPYGQQAKGTPQAGPGYTGHVNDPDTRLVYMQQRYYDPVIGRFISPDPIRPTPGNIYNFNRYVYANDNPMRYTDPDGRRIRLADLGDSALVEKLIGTLASGSFKVNKSGYLTYQIKPSANGGKSTYYTSRLMSAIDSKKVIVVHVASAFKSPITHKMENFDSQDGGGATLKTSVGGKHTKAAVFDS